MVRLTLEISQEADDLLRSHIRRKGDLSRIINNLILKEYKQLPANTDEKTSRGRNPQVTCHRRQHLRISRQWWQS
jgi:hypothetical protein